LRDRRFIAGRSNFNQKGAIEMNKGCSDGWGYVLAGFLGAIGGGLAVALATKAIPKMMSRMMAGMMQNMMGCMGKSGASPADI